MMEIQITLEELYTVIGELEMVRRKQGMQIQSLQKQVEELTNGKLGKPDDNEQLHHVRGRGEGS
jgi:hypothetical protein